ncbi:MAG: MATE family efflux transporter [Acidobacteriota bacterium]
MKNENNFSVKKYILKMALPAIAGLSTQMVVSLVDTSMVGRLNEAEYALAAMGLGVLATWALISFFSSLSTGTHVLVARNFGAGDYEGCGRVLNSSLILTLIVGIVIGFAGVSSAYSIAHFFAADPQVGNYAGQFLFYRFMGIPFFLVTVAYRGFFFGIGKTKVFMFSGILVNLLNIVFNYFLIFGNLGLPRMGVAGSGLGSTLATICEVLFYICVSFYPKYRRKFGYFHNFRFDLGIVKSIYKISIPVSLQNVFILVAFLSFVAITGLIGTMQQAATQLVISSIFISLLPCFGFGIAAQTLVGNNLGSRKLNLARAYAIETSKLATYYTLVVGAFFLLAPRVILHILTTEAKVVEVAVPALRIAGFAQIFYAAGIVLANTLQAAGKTLYVMLSEVLTSWILFLPLSYFFGVFLHFGLLGAWGALPLYVLSYTIIVYLKFSKGNWGKITV